MTDFFDWLLGIKASPDWVRGPDSQWHLEFQALPEGYWAAVAWPPGSWRAGIWWLYRLEGRSLSLAVRLVLGSLRLLIVLAWRSCCSKWWS